MRIGIPGYEIDGMFGVHSAYMEFASIVGNPEIVVPTESCENFIKGLDGILLPGGADVFPGRYGFPGFFTGSSRQHLEWFDLNILPKIIAKIPIFGICRGLQTINVVLGGTLIQHLFFHGYSSGNLDLVHGVKNPTSDEEKFKVNSFHHQAVKKLGAGLKCELISSDGQNIIEAVSGKNIFAVQWHPERMMDSYSIEKFKSLFS